MIKSLISFKTISALIVAVILASAAIFSTPSVRVARASSHVCPGTDMSIDANGWIKLNKGQTPNANQGTSGSSTETLISYTAPAGYVVDQVCAKGGEEQNANGYLFTVPPDTNPHTCTKSAGPNTFVGTITIAGLNTQVASVTKGGDADACAGISHASFHVIPDPNPTPTPTPEPDEPLVLESLCHDGPVGQVKVTNPNDDDFNFRWRRILNGFFFPFSAFMTVDANNSTTFAVPWPGRIRIRYQLNGNPRTETVRQNATLCTQPTPTPTPDPECEGQCEPTPTPTPSPTPTPDPEKGTELETTALSCDNRSFDAKVRLTENGQPVQGVKVKFTYHWVTHEKVTDANGRAQAGFWYEGNEGLKVEPENGFPSHNRGIALPNNEVCPEIEFGIGGGDYVEPEVLAETGVFTDILVKSLGALGGMLTLAGSALYAKKNA